MSATLEGTTAAPKIETFTPIASAAAGALPDITPGNAAPLIQELSTGTINADSLTHPPNAPEIATSPIESMASNLPPKVDSPFVVRRGEPHTDTTSPAAEVIPPGAMNTSSEAGTDANVAAAASDAQRRFGASQPGPNASGEQPIDAEGINAWRQETSDLAGVPSRDLPGAVTNGAAEAATPPLSDVALAEQQLRDLQASGATPERIAQQQAQVDKLKAEAASRPATPVETATPTGNEAADKQTVRRQELKDKKDKTPEEWRELNQLNREATSTQRLEDFNRRLEAGEVLSDNEMAERDKLEAEKQGTPTTAETPNLTPEQQAEQIKNEVADLVEKIQRHEGDPVQMIQRLEELRAQSEGIQTTAQEQAFAREFADLYLRDPKEYSKRFAQESQTQKDVRKAIQTIMALEMQLRNLPTLIEKKREQRDAAKAQLDGLRQKMENASSTEKIQATMDWGAKANELAVLRNDIRLLKDGKRIISAEKRRLMLEIDTKLNLRGNLNTVSRWVLYGAEDAYDSFVLGVDDIYDNE
ncbi:MAG TPA: hypothetical protein VG935_01615 [Patescibacteria group bacterium]|nr:hypothetical protein [Patescibacteria group bacterium]